MDSIVNKWIKDKLLEFKGDKIKVKSLYNLFLEETKSKCNRETYNRSIRRNYNKIFGKEVKSENKEEEKLDFFNEDSFEENNLYEDNIEKYIDYSSKLSKQKQALLDKNRIYAKIFREKSRIFNVIEEYNKEVVEILKNVRLDDFNVEKKEDLNNEKKFGVLSLSDLHFNELIQYEENIGNVYDFEVAAKRLKKFVVKADKIFKACGVTHVLVACLGDFMNSDRRKDELLNESTNRMKATFLAVYILEQLFIDLVQRGYKVSTASVSGNESRVNEFHEFSNIMVTDNYDFTIWNILRLVFRDYDINFIKTEFGEAIVDLNGFNILLTHGRDIKNSSTIQEIIGRFAAKGIVINHILHGHYHSSVITDFSARSASLCGANAYSEKKLNCMSRASQNILIVNEDKSVDTMKIDLQNVKNIKGYDIKKELEEYNAKSVSKLKTNVTIHKIVI